MSENNRDMSNGEEKEEICELLKKNQTRNGAEVKEKRKKGREEEREEWRGRLEEGGRLEGIEYV